MPGGLSEQRGEASQARDANPLVALLYHELRPEASAYSYVLPCSRFAEHLQLFAQLQQESPDSSLPLLTFDDGHASDFAYALPLLEQAGMTAHFFITAGWTGTLAGFMRPQELRALHAAGHTIGAHSWSHTLLTQCTDEQLAQELRNSRAALEDWIAAPVTTMSLPGGRGDARVLRACRAAGYTTVWTSTPGPTTSPQAPEIGRYNILAGTTDTLLRQLLAPHSAVLQRAGRVSRAKAVAQRALGDRLYGRLWAVLNRQEAGTLDGTAP